MGLRGSEGVEPVQLRMPGWFGLGLDFPRSCWTASFDPSKGDGFVIAGGGGMLVLEASSRRSLEACCYRIVSLWLCGLENLMASCFKMALCD